VSLEESEERSEHPDLDTSSKSGREATEAKRHPRLAVVVGTPSSQGSAAI